MHIRYIAGALALLCLVAACGAFTLTRTVEMCDNTLAAVNDAHAAAQAADWTACVSALDTLLDRLLAKQNLYAALFHHAYYDNILISLRCARIAAVHGDMLQLELELSAARQAVETFARRDKPVWNNIL